MTDNLLDKINKLETVAEEIGAFDLSEIEHSPDVASEFKTLIEARCVLRLEVHSEVSKLVDNQG